MFKTNFHQKIDIYVQTKFDKKNILFVTIKSIKHTPSPGEGLLALAIMVCWRTSNTALDRD